MPKTYHEKSSNTVFREIFEARKDTTKSNPLKSLLISSAVIGGAGAIILDIPKVYENVLSLIIGNNPEAGFTCPIEYIGYFHSGCSI